MARATRKTYDPLIAAALGFPLVVMLEAPGTLSVANTLDEFVVPLCLSTDRAGVVMALAEVQYFLGSLGTTSGATAARIVKNADTTNGVLDSASIAYNASVPYVQNDVRVYEKGKVLLPGDILRLDVTAIPGVASANLRARLVFKVYSIDA